MATRTRVERVDDIDGEVLPAGKGETVEFSLDGVSYEIDLGTRNAEALRGHFRDLIAAGRRVTVTGGRSRTVPAPTHGYDPRAVRKWAASNRVDVPARGRIPQAVVDRFLAEGN